MTCRNSIGLMIGGVLLTFVTTLSAQTQPASSFDQLQVLVKPGDRIYVRDATGALTRGTLIGLSSTSLHFKTKAGTRDFAEGDIFEIKQWRNDSLLNGMLIGTAIGGTVGAIGAGAYCGEYRRCAGVAAALIGVWSGIGAGVGAGIDALIPHKKTIYFGGSRAGHLRFSPVLGGSRKGVAVA